MMVRPERLKNGPCLGWKKMLLTINIQHTNSHQSTYSHVGFNDIQCQEENWYDRRYQSPKWKTVECLKDCENLVNRPYVSFPAVPSSSPIRHIPLITFDWRNCGEASQNTQTKMFGWWHLFLWRLSVRRSRPSGPFLKTWEPRKWTDDEEWPWAPKWVVKLVDRIGCWSHSLNRLMLV